MLTAASLNGYSLKNLAQMAKTRGVRGWHEMRKDQLVRALLREAKRKASASRASAKTGEAAKRPAKIHANSATNGRATLRLPANGVAAASNGKAHVGRASSVSNGKHVPRNGVSAGHNGKHVSAAPKPPVAPPKRDAKVEERLMQMRAAQAGKDLSIGDSSVHRVAQRDRLVLMVRGPYWLHAFWELTRRSVERARAALGQDWHAARPVLRLSQVPAGATTTSVESPVRDIPIHGGVNNWYIDVPNPPKTYRLSIGYLAGGDKFHLLSKSNIVSTPAAGSSDDIDSNWGEVAANYEKIYAMSAAPDGASLELKELFEERLRRPMGSPMIAANGSAAETYLPKKRPFNFEIDAELLVFGTTNPDAHVTLLGDPVKVRPDGTFTVRFSLPNCRQVIPAVASSRDGIEQRTVVLAVERNTKTMEPLVRDTAAE